MSDEKWHVIMVLPEQMQKLLEKRMEEGGVTWSDLEAVKSANFFGDPNQIQWTFKRHAGGGDQDYADWEPGDVVYSSSDPERKRLTIAEIHLDNDGKPMNCTLTTPEGEEGVESIDTLYRIVK